LCLKAVFLWIFVDIVRSVVKVFVCVFELDCLWVLTYVVVLFLGV
jgi:hypothetical protein